MSAHKNLTHFRSCERCLENYIHITECKFFDLMAIYSVLQNGNSWFNAKQFEGRTRQGTSFIEMTGLS